MLSYWHRLKTSSGIDFHILFTLLMRSWTVVAGLVMILGIPHWFSQAEQGYYFTYYSILGLQVFFELGFNYVVVQLVGHEMANLKHYSGDDWIGDPRYLDRLTSLVKLLHRWYRVIAVLFFLIVGLAGNLFFLRTSADAVSGWQIGWFLLVLCSAINLYISPFLAVAEGAGKIGEVARLRLFQSIVGYSLLWICLFSGAGIWAVPLVAMTGCLGSTFWLHRYGSFIGRLGKRQLSNSKNRVDWRKEIFPFQWRIALSWVSGYFIFQLFNPVIFAYQGAAEAGRAGMALTIFSTLLSISMSWVSAKSPVLSGYIARKESAAAKNLFWSLVLRSGVFNIASCVSVLFVVWLMHRFNFSLANRIADLPTLCCLAAVSFANHFIFSAATFMRAHKQEPLLLCSIIVGLLCLVGVFIGAQQSIFLTMLIYAFVTICVGLPWCWVIFNRFNRVQARNPEKKTLNNQQRIVT